MKQAANLSFSALSVSPKARQTLGLEPHDDLHAAKKKFRDLMLQTHPDKGGSTAAATKLNLAWEEVKNATAPRLQPPRSSSFRARASEWEADRSAPQGADHADSVLSEWNMKIMFSADIFELHATWVEISEQRGFNIDQRQKLAKATLAAFGMHAYRCQDLRSLVASVQQIAQQCDLNHEAEEVYEHVYKAYRARIVMLHLGKQDCSAKVSEATEFANNHGFPTNDLAPPRGSIWNMWGAFGR